MCAYAAISSISISLLVAVGVEAGDYPTPKVKARIRLIDFPLFPRFTDGLAAELSFCCGRTDLMGGVLLEPPDIND